MTTEKTFRDMTALVKSKAEKQGGQTGTFWAFELVERGQTKPVIYSWFDAEAKAVAEIEIGQTWDFRISTKPNPNRQGTFFRNIEGVLGKSEKQDAPLSAAAFEALAERDPIRVSIERQTALKAAVELAASHLHRDEGFTRGQVIETAKAFYSWIAGEEG